MSKNLYLEIVFQNAKFFDGSGDCERRARAEIAADIAAAVQSERDAILSKANDLEFSPAKWSDLIEFISGDMFPAKAQE